MDKTYLLSFLKEVYRSVDVSEAVKTDVKKFMLNLGSEILAHLKKGNSLSDTYFEFSGKSLPEKYDVKLNPEQLKEMSRIVKRIKSVPVRTSSKHNPHMLFQDIITYMK
jgi:hypothetical protein